MRHPHNRTVAFPLLISGITVAGLLSALIDGTLGWETLVHTILIHATQ